jgi:oxygen-independent coproporphyrinogen-3 oxidase
VTNLSLRKPYTQALLSEMSLQKKNRMTFDTLYLGGGTPSLLNDSLIDAILTCASYCFTFHGNSEVSIEVNPGTVDLGRLRFFRSCGINRLTIGIQSFDKRQLRFLGRPHTADDSRKAIEYANASGFASIGLDMIYGIPNQSRNEWLTDLKEAISFHPDHLSCYMLTYERGTPLDHQRRQGSLKRLSEKTVAAMFLDTVEYLTEQGYEHYEISNFGRKTDQQKVRISKHNFKYWSNAPYFGLGPGAHSYCFSKRWWNFRDLNYYIDRILQGQSAIEYEETLTPTQLMIETVLLSLRTSDGIDLHQFEKKFGVCFKHQFIQCLSDFIDEDFMALSESGCKLTKKGMLFHDSIVCRLIQEIQSE